MEPTVRVVYDVVDDESWRSLLLWLCCKCSYLVVTTRKAESNTLSRLTGILGQPINEERVAKWPGTELLFGRTALRSKFRISAADVDDLFALARVPWEWIEPRLPEDLTFLTHDNRVVARSVTHERFLAVDLPTSEASELVDLVPGMRILDGEV